MRSIGLQYRQVGAVPCLFYTSLLSLLSPLSSLFSLKHLALQVTYFISDSTFKILLNSPVHTVQKLSFMFHQHDWKSPGYIPVHICTEMKVMNFHSVFSINIVVKQPSCFFFIFQETLQRPRAPCTQALCDFRFCKLWAILSVRFSAPSGFQSASLTTGTV